MAYRPISPERLRIELVDALAARTGHLRVALDGAHCTQPDVLAASLIEPLGVLGRPAVHVPAERFWRDASVRLEYGHTDTHSLRHDWLDAGALRRELLDPLGTGGSGQILLSLRDPQTNRATHEPRRTASPSTIVLVSGQFLLEQELPFDCRIQLVMSPAALRRHTPPELAWTLPAVEGYELDLELADSADVIIRLDDPRHPAVRFR